MYARVCVAARSEIYAGPWLSCHFTCIPPSLSPNPTVQVEKSEGLTPSPSSTHASRSFDVWSVRSTCILTRLTHSLHFISPGQEIWDRLPYRPTVACGGEAADDADSAARENEGRGKLRLRCRRARKSQSSPTIKSPPTSPSNSSPPSSPPTGSLQSVSRRFSARPLLPCSNRLFARNPAVAVGDGLRRSDVALCTVHPTATETLSRASFALFFVASHLDAASRRESLRAAGIRCAR